MKIQLLAQVKSTVYDRLAQHNLDFLLGIVKALPHHKRHMQPWKLSLTGSLHFIGMSYNVLKYCNECLYRGCPLLVVLQ